MRPTFFFVVMPFSQDVRFFGSVLRRPIFVVSSREAIILPAAFRLWLSLFVFTYGAVVGVAPVVFVRNVGMSPFQTFPFFCSFQNYYRDEYTIGAGDFFVVVEMAYREFRFSVCRGRVRGQASFCCDPRSAIFVFLPFRIRCGPAQRCNFLSKVVLCCRFFQVVSVVEDRRRKLVWGVFPLPRMGYDTVLVLSNFFSDFIG